MNKVVTRFAPSPTGHLHIGGARTAIFCWLLARHFGGEFHLRIEDTDLLRSKQEYTDSILASMRWLGLDWDGPLNYQTQRTELYNSYVDKLLETGHAYWCSCTPEEVEAMREKARAQGLKPRYNGCCRERNLGPGEGRCVRLKAPQAGKVVFDDMVKGRIAVDVSELDDMVIRRADGMPTYNMAVVVDDYEMGITHVIRGDDHVSNTPRQILIYEALGFDVPTFAHLSMILGPDGKKLSKRHGAASVEEFCERGYLPDAMVNFLALLGWSLDGETTLIDRKTLCERFSLDRVTKKDAVFDETKLDWMNGQYIKEMGANAWVQASLPWLQEIGATPEDVEARPDFYLGLYPLVAERLTRLDDAAGKLAFMFWGPEVRELDEKSVNKVLKKEGARADEALRACRGVLADEGVAWEAEALQEACRAEGERLELKPKLLFQPLRVAVCGNMVSPPLFESIELLSREDVLARIDYVTKEVFGG